MFRQYLWTLDKYTMFTILATAFLLADLVNGYGRIINGDDTTISQHPYQVSLESGGSHRCGGSIISSHWVLTAAHCLPTISDRIALNNGNLGTKATYGIDNVIPHPNYNNGTGAYPNNIALVKTTTAMNFGIFGHDIIPLAEESDTFDGDMCTITGWGRTESGSISSILQETTGTILTNSDCSSRWGSNYNYNAHICIDNKSTGACNADSGGPMACGGKLAGVTSWGKEGCDTAYPSVYARVSTYRSWIDNTMKQIKTEY